MQSTMRIEILNCRYLFTFLLLGSMGCETTPRGSYRIDDFEAGFKHAQQAIDRKDWDAAYRHLEHNLYVFDKAVKSRAVAMISAHPEIAKAAHTSFSKAALYEYARNNPASPSIAAIPIGSEDTPIPIERYDELEQLSEGCVAVDVRTAKDGEVQQLTFVSKDEAIGTVMGFNHLIGAVGGLTAAPLMLVYVASGAVGIPAAYGTVSSLEARRRSALETVLGAVDFEGTADAALRLRLPSNCPVSYTHLRAHETSLPISYSFF